MNVVLDEVPGPCGGGGSGGVVRCSFGPVGSGRRGLSGRQRADRVPEHPGQASASGCPYGTPASSSPPGQRVTVSQLDCTGSTDQHVFASPDGTEVIFASNRNDGVDFELYTMPLSTDGTASGTPTDVSQSLPSGASDDYPSWAPAAPGSQNLIIFHSTRGGGLPELYTEDLNTPGSVAPVFTQTQPFSDTEPVYDPSNANEIAFVRTSGSGKSQIYTYNFVTHALVDLSAADGDQNSNDSKPDFAPSPNGQGVQLFVFQSDRPTPNAVNGPCAGTQLYTMSDQSGSAITPVFQQQSGAPPGPTGCRCAPPPRTPCRWPTAPRWGWRTRCSRPTGPRSPSTSWPTTGPAIPRTSSPPTPPPSLAVVWPRPEASMISRRISLPTRRPAGPRSARGPVPPRYPAPSSCRWPAGGSSGGRCCSTRRRRSAI